MRVVSGTAKGRRLKAPPGFGTRPTSDKVKEAIFDLLQVEWSSSLVLDLFAGSGALGIEALSRGARGAVFVEKDPVAIKFLKANLKVCNMLDRASVVMAEAIRFLQRGSGGTLFGVILADPPYSRGLASRCLREVGKGNWIEEQGVLALEHFWKEELPESFGALARMELRRYGDTCVSLYVMGEAPWKVQAGRGSIPEFFP